MMVRGKNVCLLGFFGRTIWVYPEVSQSNENIPKCLFSLHYSQFVFVRHG